MSSNLMNTEPGGEQTQYEGIHTYVEPHAKQAGQLGNPSLSSTSPSSQPKANPNEPNTQGISTADKIRYGQSIQEGGMGGKTNATGEAVTEGGFGGTEGVEGEEGSAAKERRQQGYGGDKDMDRSIGA